MELVLLLVALAGSAVYSGSETGYYALNRLKLRHVARSQRGAAVLERTVRSPAGFLCTLLVANNIANDAAVHAARGLLAGLGFERLELWTTLLLTPVVFLVGEVGPKQFMLADPLRRSVMIAPVLAVTRVLLMPVTIPLVAVTRWLSPADEGALSRFQLSSYLHEGRHGLPRDARVLAAARRVVESHGRGLLPFLHRRIPTLRTGASNGEVRSALREAPDGLALLERPGGAPALCTGVAWLRALPGQDPAELAVDLPVLSPDLDLSMAFNRLRQLGRSRALVGRPGAWEGLFDLEYALGVLLAPDSTKVLPHA